MFRFVAKPIGRLGGPGLIPVAFVEIRNPATGQPIEVLPDTIPMVEEWKKATADYKAAAIPLGRFDFAAEQNQPVANSPYGTHARNGSSSQSTSHSHSQSQHQQPMPRSASSNSVGQAVNGNGSARPEVRSSGTGNADDAMLPPGRLMSLEVPSFHNETGTYWFRIQVIYHPDDRSAPAFALSLYRTYEDFYDFQISLLDTFPFEAGRPAKGKEDQTPPERILPFMPGPVDDEIDDELTEYRREELDAYVKALVDLHGRGADYILRHELIRGFFAAKYGDHFQETERQDAVEELDEMMGGTRISSGTSRAAADPRAPSAMSRHSQRSQPGVGRTSGGYSTQQGPPSHSRQVSRGPSPLPPHVPESQASSSTANRPPSSSRNQQQQPPQTSTSINTPGAAYLSGPLSTATTSSSWGHPPNSAVSGNGPVPTPTSASQPPYVKIKIYDRATDDLIAIRVHPHVTYDDLYEKVNARLGSHVSALRYKDASMAGTGGYGEIRDDRELRDWMGTEDQKLVLYAER